MARRRLDGILLIYHRPVFVKDASTVREHIDSFSQYSVFPVCSINTALGFPRWLWRYEYPIIVLHYSLFGSKNYPMSQEFVDYIDSRKGSYKVAFFQDEYYFCPKRFAFINEHGINTIFSLLEPEEVPKVYGRYTKVSRVLYTLTGYVSEKLIKAAAKHSLPDERRTIDIGYRGRELLPYMGRAAREKTAIAEIFKEKARGFKLHLDIETKEYHRLYGKDWHRFLGNCRGCLGVEAGVSVFDLEGVVYREFEKLRQRYPSATFDEMVAMLAPVMDPWEGRVFYRTVSPRHFEAAAFNICQILFEGRYSGVLEPMRHYIPLKKDFSNFDDVIDAFLDGGFRNQLAKNAYADLIASGQYSYKRFIEGFDRELMKEGLHPARYIGISARTIKFISEQRPDAIFRRLIRIWQKLPIVLIRKVYYASLRSRFMKPVVFIVRPVLRPIILWYRRRRKRNMI